MWRVLVPLIEITAIFVRLRLRRPPATPASDARQRRPPPPWPSSNAMGDAYNEVISAQGCFNTPLRCFETHYDAPSCDVRPEVVLTCRMSPSVRPVGRPSRGVCKIGSDTGRTAHFRAVGAQRAALTPDIRPVAPTTIGWPIWPAIDRARPFECHGAITHVTATTVGAC